MKIMLVFPGKYVRRMQENDALAPRKIWDPTSGRWLVAYQRAGTVPHPLLRYVVLQIFYEQVQKSHWKHIKSKLFAVI